MNRYNYIDSLRGLSAVLVIISHSITKIIESNGFITANPTEMAIYYFIDTFFDLGKIGVIIFFCVSGYLIPNSLRDDRPEPIKKFFISRIFRLYPAYWVSIPFAILALYYLPDKPLSAITIAANFSMLQQFIGIANIQGLYWTLQIEIIFYILCVILFYFGFIRKAKVIFGVSGIFVLTALLMSVARYSFEVKLPVALPLSLAIMFGANLYRRFLVDGDADSGRYIIWLIGIFALTILPICILAYGADYGFGETWYRYFISYFVSLTIFYVFTARVKVELPLFTYLGRISYSMYLFGTVARILSWTALGAFVAVCPAGVAICVTLAVAVGISSLVYYAVEKPAIELGRRLSSRQSPSAI